MAVGPSKTTGVKDHSCSPSRCSLFGLNKGSALPSHPALAAQYLGFCGCFAHDRAWLLLHRVSPREQKKVKKADKVTAMIKDRAGSLEECRQAQ
jgi:hypothetical protein